MTRVVILGAGVMGTAFANPLSDRGMAVDLVGTHLDEEIIAEIKQTRTHPRLKADVGANVTAHQLDALSDVFSRPCDLVVVGVSTPGASWAIEQLTGAMSGTPPIVLLTKGIGETPDRIEILPSLMKRAFARSGVKHGPIGAVGGPCIAGELAVRRQTSAIIGFDEPGL
ncbi:MAG: 2-dehydropantoate 2-reductase N-terminal domain-containing protein, partial [Crocosphaera sp.]|nr:2-dehydropantoate 2-reductase N-terminal domain-containing protein [Crocosphaera sp.]